MEKATKLTLTMTLIVFIPATTIFIIALLLLTELNKAEPEKIVILFLLIVSSMIICYWLIRILAQIFYLWHNWEKLNEKKWLFLSVDIIFIVLLIDIIDFLTEKIISLNLIFI
ncbi:hypothetical protein A2533_04755 [Candidatus Falkowbacteria bacterium RIFOXYD2_FULL_35_9]|uniref:Uncharacterized protein n=1 Tax=Candidatus Falkowbacteria bacterium RIFOXYC2_FULL_36_12 TaxID=1798002 RepID=A0A1F5SY87_9BACT|nr:MAG: hypothetical protein A2300_02455 [Candidatus Falkowbacteria bacterium RIFOXYB2_FULL_35_7]OGF31685.1 MAG: hypothetical protein A2478_04320 [Candidatus Falkowbacteria bacterium RIFOXYC2_FULL_36_12]OGF33188.1 MAG: hypothetical protein A2223_04970 [Candidatus Falkowbacteria bacterium RIFOXYA2_FULL_35_8]OGF46166.1 MAG: hypothetical protein A2533_04755 [Candidatus Falkowbacteria bacterium RIFOXYD2_FULL_35_9]